MGVMNKMRESTKYILWILVFSFGGLWMLQDSGVFETLGLGPRHLAVVNGEVIAFETYQGAVQQQVEAYEQQGQEVTPQLRAFIEERVYDALVDNVLREQEMERLGVAVSDAEVADLLYGDNPDVLIRQFFPDGQGGVDREAVRNIASSTEYRADFIGIQEDVRRRRQQAKLDALIGSTVRVTQADVNDEYVRRNQSAAARYVALRYADIPDAEIEVSDRDVENYYREIREDFQRDKTFDVSYLTFELAPAAEDSANALTRFRDIAIDFEDTTNDSIFVANLIGREIDNVYEVDTLSATEAPADAATELFRSLTPGTVAGPFIENGEVLLYKVIGTVPADGQTVRARHILVSEEAGALNLLTELSTGASFEALAAQHSTDTSNKDRGGDLGWFGEGRMVPEFQAAAFAAPIGEVVGPVQTQFGYHLIRVDARATQDAVVVPLRSEVTVDYDGVQERAEDVQYFAEDARRTLAEQAEQDGYTVRSVTITDAQTTIPGLDADADAVRYIKRGRVGEISQPFNTADGFVVVEVTNVTEEGFRPFEEVAEQVRRRYLTAQKQEIAAQRLAGATGDLDAVASAVGSSVQTAPNVTYTNPTVPGLGRETQFVGAAFGLSTGASSQVIEGQTAAYMLQVTSKNVADPSAMSDEDRDQIQEQLLGQKRQQVRQQWIERLRDDAEITDNRALLL
ncbi:MAG: peptidyl-prolyl cis-trans isomerase [Bacteroidota bacterium]